MEEFNPFLPIKENDIAELWKKAIFVFDANVLLNLYRYTEKTSAELLSILEKMESQIWIPHQVALEYHFNRKIVIINQKKSYGKIRTVFQEQFSNLKNDISDKLSDYIKSHPRLNIKDLIEQINKVDEAISTVIDENENSHPGNLVNEDPYLNKVWDLFLHRTGVNEYDQKSLDKIYAEGKERYEKKIPPGYKDLVEKKGELKIWGGLRFEGEYGDLIVWNQIIDKSKKEKKPVIFITEDTKDDWWHNEKGLTLGPRVELIEEFKRKTNQDFYMYRVFRFMEFAKENTKSNVSAESISEARDLKIINKNESNGFKLLNSSEKLHFEVQDSQAQDESFLMVLKAIAYSNISRTDVVKALYNSDKLAPLIEKISFPEFDSSEEIISEDEKFVINIQMFRRPASIAHIRAELNLTNNTFYTQGVRLRRIKETD